MSNVAWSKLPWRAKSLPAGTRGMVRCGTVDLGAYRFCAVTGRRDRFLPASVGFLAIEGMALGVGRGECPLGPFQRELGDPVPFFELVLPPRAAKAAIPILRASAWSVSRRSLSRSSCRGDRWPIPPPRRRRAARRAIRRSPSVPRPAPPCAVSRSLTATSGRRRASGRPGTPCRASIGRHPRLVGGHLVIRSS